MTDTLDLFTTFVHLREDGSATPRAWTPDFWRTLVLREGDRIVGARHGAEPSDFHPDMWEMHPRGDELLYLIAGAIEAIFDERSGERLVTLRKGDTCVVPRGIWHRLVIREPSDLLFVTPADGTQLKPVTKPR
ncbi:MAG TPA: cupin domain-containing protein [Methylomirabilota bacterium]|jgi:mannose-6-phosphate isomerase-like protein (cupin superfamily)|nr:cupin domain-containing protein [Methylomirabilota bacterium]